MRAHRESAFARGFWNGFCSPMLLFDTAGFETESRLPTKYFATDWKRAIDAILGRLPFAEKADSLPARVKGEPALRWTETLPVSTSLEGLERMVPGAADRVLKMLEEEHVVRLDRRRSLGRESIRGHWMGFALVIVSIAAGVATAFVHSPWQVSVAFVGVPLFGVVRTFVPRGRNAR